MNDTGVTRDTELIFRRVSDAFPFATPESNAYCWWVLVAGVLLVGAFFIGWMYRRDSRTCHWYVATPLAILRLAVYVLLAIAFLLPANQTWETVEKNSRVVILLDVSPSVSQISDDFATAAAPKPPTRLSKVLDFLTDDKVGFLKKLIESHPVNVYRFGSRLDDESQIIANDSPVWTTAEWDAWTKYDFKPWVLRGLSPAGVETVRKSTAWNGVEPGTAEWATGWGKLPEAEVKAELTEDDAKVLLDNRSKLEKRIDVARSIMVGTNVPDSVTAAVNREAANMVQAVIVFTDGRSNLGSSSAYSELKERASREKIPIFTVAVGEPRENIAISITDLQAPDRVPPDEPHKVIVEADGVGLEKQEVEVKLGIYLPTRDPKKDLPDHEMVAKLTFQTGEPPHGQVEFVIDADKLPEALTEDAKKEEAIRAGKRKQLKQGAWSMVARIARDKREVFPNPEHISPPRLVQVLESPLRILLWASGPTREYQTLRTLLMREVNEKRAEMSVFLQNEGGQAGNIVQDVAPDRLLIRFPNRFDVTSKATDKPEDKYYNLHEYDLIVAFDPDWSELSAAQVEDLRTWVVDGGGGFVYVAGPIHTYQLARADETGRLKPALEMLCALPDDIILMQARPTPRSPRRVLIKPNADFDVLKLDDTVADDPTAGWERFFTGRDKYVPDADQKKNLNPKNGFFSYYPLKATKPGAAVLMEILDVNERGEAEAKPYFVANQPGRGRTAFLAWGQMWRTRAVDPNYFDRFWIRLARNMSSARRNVQSFRGQVLVNKEYTSGSMIRVQTRLLAPNSRPYLPDAISPKFIVEQLDSDGTSKKKFGPYPLASKKGASGFDGYYTAQVLADPKLFPPGDFKYKVVVDIPDSPGDTISGEFMVRKSDPELDNARPDFDALISAANTLEDVQAKITEPGVFDRLKGSATDPARVKLAFKIAEREKLGLIPYCIKADRKEFRNRGPVEDLWDTPFALPSWMTSWFTSAVVNVSYLLVAAIGLLAIEWAVRKTTRLA